LTAQTGRGAKGISARDETVVVPASSSQKASGKAPVPVAQSVSRAIVDEATKRSGKINLKKILISFFTFTLSFCGGSSINLLGII
jgi:hypothetical protein